MTVLVISLWDGFAITCRGQVFVCLVSRLLEVNDVSTSVLLRYYGTFVERRRWRLNSPSLLSMKHSGNTIYIFHVNQRFCLRVSLTSSCISNRLRDQICVGRAGSTHVTKIRWPATLYIMDSNQAEEAIVIGLEDARTKRLCTAGCQLLALCSATSHSVCYLERCFTLISGKQAAARCTFYNRRATSLYPW